MTASARDRLAALSVAAALFAVYAAGASRTIAVGDSGDLVTAAHVLGVPHPTGYPLYVLAGKAWSMLLPVGSVAFRLSLFSAAAAAAACGLLFLLCRRLDTGVPAALAAAGTLAFAPAFWGEATLQRVYALNALFLMAAMLAAWRWWQRRDAPSFALTALIGALGAANHTTMGVFLIAFGLFALASDARAVLRPRPLALAAAATLLGLLPYAHLPLAARRQAPLLWGDPGTWSGFLDIVLRRDFWWRAWVESPADAVTVAADYLASLPQQLTWPGAALAVAGLVAAARRRRALLLLIVLVMAGNLLAMLLHGSSGDLFVWHRYYIPSYAMAALLLGLGVEALPQRGAAAWRALALAVPCWLAVQGWTRFDRSEDQLAEWYARTLLAEVAPHAIVHAADDSVLFPLLYLTLVAGERPDVAVVALGSLPLPAAAALGEGARPIYFTHDPGPLDGGLAALPGGLTYRLVRSGQPTPAPAALPAAPPGVVTAVAAHDDLTQSLLAQYHFMRAVGLEARDWPGARAQLERAAAAAPGDDVLFYRLAVFYLRNGLLDEAAAALAHSARLNPRDLSSSPGVRAAALLEQVRAEQQRVAALEASLDDGGAAPRSPAWHRHRAAQLDARGEARAARAHYRRAADAERDPVVPP